MSVTNFHRGPEVLTLSYEPREGLEGIFFSLKKKGRYAIQRILHVTSEQVSISDPTCDHSVEITFGIREGAYFNIDRGILEIEFDLFISTEVELQIRHFLAHRDISIFRRFNEFKLTQIFIGGNHPEAIPIEDFESLITNFPNSTEVTKYARTRIDSIIGHYLDSPTDFKADFEKYRNQKRSWKGSFPRKALASYETDKFSALIEKLNTMLNGVHAYKEKQWQDEILQIVLLLFPRYIHSIPEGRVYDSWQQKKRRVDFLLVDATGYVDIIEIKRPAFNEVLTQNTGRDNYLPRRNLSEAVMQVEKYIFHLNRSGDAGEKALNDKYQAALPNDLTIKIVNPTGMIIMGRDDGLSEEQRSDFEVIRRKYRNIVDIITYDDLLRRLKVIRDQFKKSSPGTSP